MPTLPPVSVPCSFPACDETVLAYLGADLTDLACQRHCDVGWCWRESRDQILACSSKNPCTVRMIDRIKRTG